jgi:hypothetical protein
MISHPVQWDYFPSDGLFKKEATEQIVSGIASKRGKKASPPHFVPLSLMIF